MGFPEALVFCRKCQVYAQHRYCLDQLPVIFIEDVTSYCDDCELKVAKSCIPDEISPLSDSINLKNVDANPAKRKLKYPINSLNRKKHRKRKKKKNQKQRHDVAGSVDKSKMCESDRFNSLQDEEKKYNGNSVRYQKSVKESEPVVRDGASDEVSASVQISQHATIDPSSIEESNCFSDAQPIIDPIWRGSFCICNQNMGMTCGIVGHLSSLACSRVHEEASLFPEVLRVELLHRSKVWPKGFPKCGPYDHNIALYFFPESERYVKIFDKLVYDVIRLDLALRAMFENAELLIFSSATC
ncbi:putative RING/FYVE/PHD zinc finger protein [Quillaja saponaria]|uniref:RING/FYVE/PHD zinc finger protein n=1 Tax=Quillaja saponaria TaxID=32244 RepID=A0AAD7M6A5_QUISA|nr:putative RING/FYVE/PHD zinc finger protein [Quillaja saponaria]